jgi:hypothetical protein
VIGRLTGAATADGGDMFWLDPTTLAVGRGYRTNAAAHRQLADILGREGVTVERADLPHHRGAAHVMHLMSVVSPVAEDLAVVFEPLAPVPLLEMLAERGYRSVACHPDEFDVQGESITRDKCSALGFGKKDGQPAMIAQTMDVPEMADGFQLVLRIKHQDSDLESFVLTQAGCIGFNGLNNKGIGICCNALPQLGHCPDGLPVAFIVRGVLEQRTEADAIAFLNKIKHASGQNYIVGGPSRAYSVECSANRVARFQPNGRDDVVWHTNHPLANDDYIERYREFLKDTAKAEKGLANTRTRLNCLEKRFTDGSPARDLDLVKAALASKDSPDYPISRPKRGNGGAFTFAATIMVLSENPTFHVAPGPPDVTAYVTLTFAK